MSVVRRAATAAVALTALAVTAHPAIADDDGPTALTLSVSAAQDSAARNTTLNCDPAGGRHPHAQEACAALDQAGGGFERLAPTRQLCPMIYAPVTATATGVWHGTPVNWTQEFSNSCLLDQRTGAVFRF